MKLTDFLILQENSSITAEIGRNQGGYLKIIKVYSQDGNQKYPIRYYVYDPNKKAFIDKTNDHIPQVNAKEHNEIIQQMLIPKIKELVRTKEYGDIYDESTMDLSIILDLKNSRILKIQQNKDV